MSDASVDDRPIETGIALEEIKLPALIVHAQLPKTIANAAALALLGASRTDLVKTLSDRHGAILTLAFRALAEGQSRAGTLTFPPEPTPRHLMAIVLQDPQESRILLLMPATRDATYQASDHSRVIARTAHELLTPVSVLYGDIENLQGIEACSNPQASAALQRLRRASEKLAAGLAEIGRWAASPPTKVLFDDKA